MADVADPSPAEATAVAASDAPVGLFKKRNAKSKSNIRKRPATPPPKSDSDDDDDYTSSEDETGHKIKRRRKNGVAIAQTISHRPDTESLQSTKFAGDTSSSIQVSNDATKQSNWYDENADGALSAKQLLGTTRPQNSTDPASNSDGTYRGTANYQSFIQKSTNAPTKPVGPVKAPTNVRMVTVTDFAPDVCKDYKQTGFCGFGDSCKFLHAREDYKQGWQLDRDWEIGSKGKTNNKSANSTEQDPEEKKLESIPFACIICKQPYKSPVVTKCGHYFCEKCALDRYKKSPSCAACGAGTNGVFNVAKDLKKLLEKKAERERSKKQKAREAGEDVSDDDDQDET